MTKKRTLIIGNKKYSNLDISQLVDSDYFDEIYRCNFGLPKFNTGSRFGTLAMCSHIYEFFVQKPRPLSEIITLYTKDGFDKKFLKEFDHNFKEQKSQFDRIYYQKSSINYCNRVLSKYKSSPRFLKQPRTGHALIFELLQQNKDIFVFGFTINQGENRESYGVFTNHSDKSPYHSKKEEIEVLNWLHKSGIIDTSFCYLKDKKSIHFNKEDESLISPRAKDILRSLIK
tara:strand:- start:880 stop:1566 length:687 start_codon:yes stop_codon:yes gene_type:complete